MRITERVHEWIGRQGKDDTCLIQKHERARQCTRRQVHDTARDSERERICVSARGTSENRCRGAGRERALVERRGRRDGRHYDCLRGADRERPVRERYEVRCICIYLVGAIRDTAECS